MNALQLGIEAVERGWAPDALTRAAIRRLCRGRLLETRLARKGNCEAARSAFLASLRSGPIAPLPEKANQQHYELPPEFFALALGPRRKYSCCYFPGDGSSLDEAEEAALAITCERAELADGQNVLELGCGWGALSLWLAERFAGSRITAVSNSVSQRLYIEAEAARRGLRNLQVVTADMNDYRPPPCGFDRIVSVEMFEHMRNYERLLARIASWLRPDGKLFVHLFCHKDLCYPFENEGAANWMGRYFFTGGIMPSANLLTQFNAALQTTRQQRWNGSHYRRTAEAWLANLDAHRDQALQILAASYGAEHARRWLQRWRLFFLAVAELFGFADGEEWFVSHYLLEPVDKQR